MIRTFKEEGRLTSTDVIRTQSTGKNTIPRCDVGRNGKPQAVRFSMMLQLVSTLAVSPAGVLKTSAVGCSNKLAGSFRPTAAWYIALDGSARGPGMLEAGCCRPPGRGCCRAMQFT